MKDFISQAEENITDNYLVLHDAGFKHALEAVDASFDFEMSPECYDEYVVVANLTDKFYCDNYPEFIVVKKKDAELVAVAFMAISFSGFESDYLEYMLDLHGDISDIDDEVVGNAFLESNSAQFYSHDAEYLTVKEFFFGSDSNYLDYPKENIKDLIFSNLRLAFSWIRNKVDRLE